MLMSIEPSNQPNAVAAAVEVSQGDIFGRKPGNCRRSEDGHGNLFALFGAGRAFERFCPASLPGMPDADSAVRSVQSQAVRIVSASHRCAGTWNGQACGAEPKTIITCAFSVETSNFIV